MRGNKILLLAASLATLMLLGVAAWREMVTRDWRVLQERYRSLLPAEAARAFPVQLRQIVAPKLAATDRCVSCHIGMAPGETPIDGDALFGPHPDVVHEIGDLGCVVCHGGQGHATERADAHGEVAHWPSPMLPTSFAEAGCGSCHTHIGVPNEQRLERGRAILERADCLACHAMDGRGGTLRPGAGDTATPAAPDLSRVGETGYARDWFERHLAVHDAATSGPWHDSFGPLSADDRGAIAEVLDSRVGAPRLVEAKALFHTLGCRGCHRVDGVGGDDGPDLTREGAKDPGQTDFSAVAGPHSLAAWHEAHFRDPAAVVPGSRMPQLGLDPAQTEALTLYMLSLRPSAAPEALWPRDRVRALRFDEREFSTDGATLYGTFCAACHGPRGEGMRYPGMAAFPAIGNPDFLAIASDRFLRETIMHGRPGRRMPAWGTTDGGLRPAEIDAVVTWIRGLAPGVAAPQDVPADLRLAGEREVGAGLYANSCASCHGASGEGGEGPALANAAFLTAATDRFIEETIRRGRRDTSMPAFGSPSPTHRVLSPGEIRDVVAFVRSWEKKK